MPVSDQDQNATGEGNTATTTLSFQFVQSVVKRRTPSHHHCFFVLDADYKAQFDALRHQHEETLRKLNRLNCTS